jgi:hypothetical protein
VIPQEIGLVPRIQGGAQEHGCHPGMTHLAEAPVGGMDVAADDAEVARRDSFAQKIILSKKRVFVEAP